MQRDRMTDEQTALLNHPVETQDKLGAGFIDKDYPRIHALRTKIDAIVAPLVNAQSGYCVVVGVASDDSALTFKYGALPTPGIRGSEVIFEIGSITKVFTSLLLLRMVEEGLVTLDDPIRALLPELAHLPSEITLLRLATHTSGLPRLPSNIIGSVLRNLNNPFAAYTTDALYRALARYKSVHSLRNFGKISYSNLGTGLLGLGLARKLGVSYEQAVVDKICTPLGLTSTVVTVADREQPRVALPHTSSGKVIPFWEMGPLGGAGALRSTAHDMLRFIQCNLGLVASPLVSVLRAAQQPQYNDVAPLDTYTRAIVSAASWLQSLLGVQAEQPYDMEQLMEGIGVGWMIGRIGADSRRMWWHNGGTSGSRSFVGFVKDTHTGVVVLSNRGVSNKDILFPQPSVDDVGLGILDYLNS